MFSQSAKFEHPSHGSFDSPEAVLKSENLSDSDKETILSEWRDSLRHVLRNESSAPDVQKTHDSIDQAIEKLTSART